MRYTIAAFNATFVRGSSEYFSLSLTHTLSIYLTTHCDCRCIVRNHPLTGSKSLWSFIEKALTFPLAKVSPQHSHDPRREWIYPSPSPPPSPSFHKFPSNFGVSKTSPIRVVSIEDRISGIRLSRKSMPSSVTLVAGFIPLYRNFRYHFTSLDYSTLYASREREIRWNRLVLETTRVAKTRGEKRKGEREKPMRLVLFGNLLSESLRRIYLARLSSCAIDSTFLFGRADNSLVCTRASFPLAWERTIVT